MIAPRERGIALPVAGGPDPLPHLFLSHSSKDDPTVSRLAEDLTICGVDVWLYTWELRVGDDLHERISDAIQKCRYVGVVISRQFDESRWTKGEVHQALSREKVESRTIVLPLLIDDIPIPPVLTNKKYLVLTGTNYYASLLHLAGIVHGLSPQRLEMAVQAVTPKTTLDCVEALRHAGHNPYIVVDRETLSETSRAGGIRRGNIVYFSPREIMSKPSISAYLKQFMRKLTDDSQV